MPVVILLVLLSQVLTPRATAALGTLGAHMPITFQGVGPIRVGMRLAVLRQVARVPLTVEPELTKGCTYAYPESGSQSIAFMLSDGVVARTDVEAPGFRTLSGAQVGDSEERIKSLYQGRFVVTPHAYSDGRYITVTSRNQRFALVFETDGEVVTSFHIGRLPEVLYVEGCS